MRKTITSVVTVGIICSTGLAQESAQKQTTGKKNAPIETTGKMAHETKGGATKPAPTPKAKSINGEIKPAKEASGKKQNK